MARRIPIYSDDGNELRPNGGREPFAATSSPSSAAAAAPEPAVQPQQSRRGYKFMDRLRRKHGGAAAARTEEEPQVVPSAHAFLNAAVEVNDETMEAIQRSERMAQEAEEMGQHAAHKIAKNREQIEVVDRTMDGIEPMTKRARKELVTMVRQLARDKCFVALFCLVVGLIVALIAVTIWRREDPLNLNKDGGGNGSAVPGDAAATAAFAQMPPRRM